MEVFVVLTRYVRPLEQVNAELGAHRDWLRSLYERDMVLFSGRLDPPVGGTAVIRAADEAELERILAEDPYAKLGLVETQVHAFTPTDFPLRTSGFDRFLRGNEE